MQRFLLKNTSFTPSIDIKDIDIYHQIIKVLRSKVGDFFIFFDGKTLTDYVYELEKIGKTSLTFSGTDIINKKTSPISISLYQALPNKLEKLEYIIGKGVEVGISSFIFFRSARSQDLNISPQKQTRLLKIAQEALEQSGRNILPNLHFLSRFPQIPKESVFFHTKREGSISLQSLSGEGKLYHLFVGPEGGWTEEEEEKFLQSGSKKVFLGEGILRTETVAPVVGFFLSQY